MRENSIRLDLSSPVRALLSLLEKNRRSCTVLFGLTLLPACSELSPPIVIEGSSGSSTTATTVTVTDSATTVLDGSTSIGDSSMPSSDGSDMTTTTAGTSGSRRQITLAGHPNGATIENVPVRVTLTSEEVMSIGSREQMWFLEDDLRTQIPFEIEQWDDGAEIWVLAPQIEADSTSIWLVYGEPALPPPPDPTEVWTNAMGVWHLDGDFKGDLVDASAMGNHGTIGGSMPGTGRIGSGRTYGGVTYDDLPAMGNSEVGSISLWFRAMSDARNGLAMMFHGSDDPGADGFGEDYNELYLALRPEDPVPIINLRGYSLESMSALGVSVEGQWYDDTWHRVTATWNIGTDQARVYVDGELAGMDNSLPDAVQFSSFLRLGGNEALPERSFAGDLDEVRMYNYALSADQAAVEYAAQLESFATVGEPEPR